MEKAKLEREGGTMVYEIEFYVPGDTEYDVDVDAYSGAVLSYDYERLYSPSTVASSSASSGSQTSQSYNQYYDDDDDDWDDHDDDDDWDDDDDDWDDDDD